MNALFEYKQQYNGDGLCSNAGYKDFSKAFAQIYMKHKDKNLNLDEETFTAHNVKCKNMHSRLLKNEIKNE